MPINSYKSSFDRNQYHLQTKEKTNDMHCPSCPGPKWGVRPRGLHWEPCWGASLNVTLAGLYLPSPPPSSPLPLPSPLPFPPLLYCSPPLCSSFFPSPPPPFLPFLSIGQKGPCKLALINNHRIKKFGKLFFLSLS